MRKKSFFFLFFSLLLAAFVSSASAGTLLDVPVMYSGFDREAGMCYLGAFAMTVGALDPAVTYPMVVSYSGVGMSAEYMQERGGILSTGIGFASIIIASETLGTGFNLGLGKGGVDSEPFFPPEMKFANRADECFYFDSGEEAMSFLKKTIDSGVAIAVHVDVKDLHADFSAISDFWKTVMPNAHIDHFLTVTGYDEKNIFFNDPTDPTPAAGKLKASAEHFSRAWEATKNLKEAPLGPWWMLFPVRKPDPAPVKELFAMISERGSGAPDAMRHFARDPSSSQEAVFLLREVAANRIAFSTFLEERGFHDAAEMYRGSGENLAACVRKGRITRAALEKSADLEEKAIALLRQ